MKFRSVIPFLLALTILLPCLAMAADQKEPTIYVIKRGDTLWGLSQRFLNDPSYWPDMWSKNAQITNPHLIYPGQKVRVFPDRLEFLPREEAKTATKAAESAPDVAEEKSFTIRGSEGFLLETDSPPFGSVIATHNDRVILGVDDIVYTDIGSSNGVKGGETFAIFSNEGPVSHPVTNEIMGKKIIPLGTLQLTDVEQKASRAIITKNYKEISPGSYLIPYRNDSIREVPLRMTTRELRGYIIESQSGAQGISAGDIVYIDLGSSRGAEKGNMLYIVRDVTVDRSVSQGKIERLPQELLGALVILETGRKTAMALVVKSIDAIYIGDKIISQTK
jgi:LysM repeat protein